MHWFWRAAAGSAAACFAFFIFEGCSRVCTALIYGYDWRQATLVTYASAVLLLPFGFIAIAVYSWITRRCGVIHVWGETCCRRCGYILRGITEPRCPECGERI